MTYVRALIFSGIIWVVVGTSLALKGIQYSVISANNSDAKLLSIFILGAVLGYLKGRFVLTKSVARYMRHIVQFEEPLKFTQLFPKSYLVLVGVMMCLGMSMRHIPIPLDIKGCIDIAVGVALYYGSIVYFKKARLFQSELP